ncbi:hypothetical protein [Streptomyces mirabilis]|uniref:Uncharacterized protein n=1 Tax=Streptomyces mirabilis TaxID=68239 RepID=A0ABU3V666_9ACTN|nr:hypothetical protein [Streptomyces mirabilis]MCX5355854.1 hypothetical protein [Streptomyces mirabilis]MDU9001495.1 hypothetical protein [Streptomyces mirabilis]
MFSLTRRRTTRHALILFGAAIALGAAAAVPTQAAAASQKGNSIATPSTSIRPAICSGSCR